MLQDLRHGFRSLVHAPAFTFAALLTLALGIAATTAIFSVAYAVLLKPLPYPQPDRLFALASDMTSQSGEMFHAIRERTRAFENVAAQGSFVGYNLVAENHTEHVNGLRVSRGYFDVMGVRPEVGRGFSVAEDQTGGPRAAVLSHDLAQRLFGNSSEATGKTVQLSSNSYVVVGVMPASYWQSPKVELWTPLQLSPRDNSWNYGVIGRLRADVPPTQGGVELDAMRDELRAHVRDLSSARATQLRWTGYQEWLGFGNRDQLVLLSGAVAFLLLIACVNVASLQLVRGVARQREMTTRAAIGAARGRLMRQVLTESLVLAVAGGALGLFAGYWALEGLLSRVPEGLLGHRHVSLDVEVAAVILAISLSVGILFGLLPAFNVFRIDVRTALSERRHSAGRRTMMIRRAFTAAQVAFAVVLLAGAGLFIRSFVNLHGVPLGFDPDHVVIGKMSLYGSATQFPAGPRVFFQRALSDLEGVPGVAAAAVSNNIPIERGLNLPIHPPAGGLLTSGRSVDWRWVGGDYFEVFGIPLRDGRTFDERDSATGLPVAVVNESFAKFFFGRPQVVGEHIQMMFGKDPPRQIVGVVADVRGRSGAGWTRGINALAAPPPPVMYVPITQVPDQTLASNAPMSWSVRTRPGAQVEAGVRSAVQSAAPQLPFLRFETMDSVIARDVETQSFLMTLFAAFAAASLALAGIGLYGLTAYSVSQRTREVGIRMALGATRGLVLRTFVVEGVVVALTGLAAGIVGARFTTVGLSTMIFGVSPHDPITLVTVSGVLLGIAAVAALVPSLRAAQTNPARAMRTE